jgi:hypothetical protein
MPKPMRAAPIRLSAPGPVTARLTNPAGTTVGPLEVWPSEPDSGAALKTAASGSAVEQGLKTSVKIPILTRYGVPVSVSAAGWNQRIAASPDEPWRPDCPAGFVTEAIAALAPAIVINTATAVTAANCMSGLRVIIQGFSFFVADPGDAGEKGADR